MLRCILLGALLLPLALTAQTDNNAVGQPAPQDTLRIHQILERARVYITKPGEEARDLDSALLLTDLAVTLSKKAGWQKGLCATYLLYSMAWREKGQKEKGKLFVQHGIPLTTSLKEPRLLGNMYQELASYYSPFNPAEKPDVIKNYELAITAFREAGDIERQAYCLKYLGDVYSFSFDPAASLVALKQSLALYQSINYKDLQEVYSLFCNNYVNIADYPQALHYALLAEQAMEDVKDTTILRSTVLNRIGRVYHFMKNIEKAIIYYEGSLAVAEKYRNEEFIVGTASNLMNCYFVRKNTAKMVGMLTRLDRQYGLLRSTALSNEHQLFLYGMFLLGYAGAGDWTKAEQFCNILLHKDGLKEVTAHSEYGIHTIAHYYIYSRQYGKAEAKMHDYDAFQRQRGDNVDWTRNKQLWYTLDSSRGNMLSAFNYYQQYRAAEDSIYSQKRRKQITVLQVEFETAQKEQNLKLKTQEVALLTNQNKIQQQEIKQSRFIRNTTLGGILILFVILGLLYYHYRHRKKISRQIEEKNASLQQLVQEKEWLLKEIHHRVKNNLHTVVSLLESQTAYLDNEALHAVRESRNRVYAMSLIHQKLYQTDNMGSIDLAVYLPELVSNLRDCFDTDQRIDFDIQVIPYKIEVAQAVPLGLILNEAITNCIKYAFTEKYHNRILISMEELDNNYLQLVIADNGKGLPDGFNSKPKRSLGMRLMHGLTEDINGTFGITSNNGTRITITFPPTILLRMSEAIVA